jgi:endonuclease YncB( thermonuclease family)
MRHFWLTTLLWGCVQFGAMATTWTGEVIHVSDGDTLWVVPEGRSKKVKVRIKGIDAPELCQNWGTQSREALRSHVMGQVVQVHSSELDQYGRTLGQVILHQQDVGEWLVAQGHAWSYRFKEREGMYDAQQHAAKSKGVGLYADPKAVRPQWFRKRHGPCPQNAHD